VERAGGVVVVEGFGIAVGIAGDGFGAAGRAVRLFEKYLSYLDVEAIKNRTSCPIFV